MSKYILHRANTRGNANHGWLDARHSFSFANWYEPSKMGFGALRVLNDDTIAAGKGFGMHPHNDMEIITIPLSGQIKHQDNIGNSAVIHAGEVQVMSAGTGIVHAEFNSSETEALKLFQIWILPNKKNCTPRYDQFKVDVSKMQNIFLQLVSPLKEDEGTWINQNAWIHMAEIDQNNEISYELKNANNGVYFMVVEGIVQFEEETLLSRDAIGIWNAKTSQFKAIEKSKILAIEVPQ